MGKKDYSNAIENTVTTITEFINIHLDIGIIIIIIIIIFLAYKHIMRIKIKHVMDENDPLSE